MIVTVRAAAARALSARRMRARASRPRETSAPGPLRRPAGFRVAIAVLLCGASINAAAQGGASALQRGVELLAAGRTDEAIVQLRAAVQGDPGSAEARYHLGRALVTGGNAAEAVPHLEAALGGGADDGPINFLLGQAQLQTGDLQAASAALTAAAASRPDFAPIQYYRAELCYRLGRTDAAAAGFAAVAEAAPRWSLPRVRSGMIALERGEMQAAIDWFREALVFNAENPALWMRLASALVATEQPVEATEAYRKAVQVGPGFMPARVALITQLNHMRDYAGVRRALDELFVNEPDHPLGRYQLANVLSVQGDNSGALEAVEVAIAGFAAQATGGRQQTPEVVGATPEGEAGTRHTYLALSRGLRAQLLMKMGRGEEAEAEGRRIIETEPWYPEAHFVVGTVLIRRGDRRGEAYLRRFQELSDAREHRELAELHMRTEELEPARVEYEAALATDPESASALIGLASVLRRTGNVAGAIASLNNARPVGPEVVAWYIERVLALSQGGHEAEARQVWEEGRAAGVLFDARVWRLMYADVAGC